MLTKDQDISHPLRCKGTTPHRPLSMTKSRIASDARGLEHRLAVRVVKGQGFAMKCTQKVGQNTFWGHFILIHSHNSIDDLTFYIDLCIV